ncbi:uncharacterized protein CLUP02_14197 [Colletotrichum lupini]|uniref:Uncharacterized protein n=1 Tax=Colletotrichum lupini TaxID=145971 RepID=A0A9Q8WMV5_9PEZI|nr:uncharacterized protein CLUP02_14197 [Colletotrichum lupini]UQC88672.1 hypothetical protein CLUP02_14197 [Colletotrichum lupini]
MRCTSAKKNGAGLHCLVRVVALSSSGTEGGYWEAESLKCSSAFVCHTWPSGTFPVNDVQWDEKYVANSLVFPCRRSRLTFYAQWQLSVSLGSCIIPIASAPSLALYFLFIPGSLATARPATLGLEINTTHMGATVECDARPGKLTEPRTGDVRFGSAYFSIPPSPFDFGKRLAVALAKLHWFSSLPRTAATKGQGLSGICAILGHAVHPIWVIPDFEIASIKQPHQGFLRRLQNLMGLDPVQPNNNTEELAFSGLSALLTEQYVPLGSQRSQDASLASFRFEARQAEAGRNSLFSASIQAVLAGTDHRNGVPRPNDTSSARVEVNLAQISRRSKTRLATDGQISEAFVHAHDIWPRRRVGNRIQKVSLVFDSACYRPPQPRGSPDFRTELIHSDPSHVSFPARLKSRFLPSSRSPISRHYVLAFSAHCAPTHLHFGLILIRSLGMGRSKFGMSDFVPLPPRRHEAMLHFLSIQSRDSFIDRLHSTPFSRVMILVLFSRRDHLCCSIFKIFSVSSFDFSC